MDDIVSLVAGILFKVVDEIEDTDIQIPEDYKIYIKTLCIVFITLFFYDNILYTLVFIFFIIPVCFYVKEIDTAYWKSLIPIPFIICMLKGFYPTEITIQAIIIYLLVCIICVYITIKESHLYPEETSERKIIGRVYLLFINIVSLIIVKYINLQVFNNLIPGIIVSIGYLSTSIISKSLVLQDAEITGSLYDASRIHAKGEL
jgi:hypothetical protein